MEHIVPPGEDQHSNSKCVQCEGNVVGVSIIPLMFSVDSSDLTGKASP